jgi:hypothetical protein
MHIPGLRSDRETVGGLVFFGRMLDKIRLHAKGQLPSDYNRGTGFDAHICRFLRVEYDSVVKKALNEKDDARMLGWCYARGRKPGDEEIHIFNAFLSKRGWNDEVSDELKDFKETMGLAGRDDIQTFFDLHDADEGRK